MVKNPNDVSFSGIYDNSNLNKYEFMMGNDNLQTLIDLARNKPLDPMVWLINVSKKTHYSIIHYLFTEKIMI